jgi:hypothetical protein
LPDPESDPKQFIPDPQPCSQLWYRAAHGKCVGVNIRLGYSQLRHRLPYTFFFGFGPPIGNTVLYVDGKGHHGPTRRLAKLSKVAAVLGSVQHPPKRTVESERRQMKQCSIKVLKLPQKPQFFYIYSVHTYDSYHLPRIKQELKK